MPKDVDHDARRQELLEAVWRTIARDGIERTTIRTIAKESGWSAGVLAHYFADKDEILDSAIKLMYERIAVRWSEKLEGLSGVAALHELVLDNLPLDDERELETRFLMNYWSRAIRDGDGVARPERRGPQLIDLLSDLVGEARDAGEISGDESPQDIAERLLALIDGFSLHNLLDPQRLPRERQVALIAQEFDRLTGHDTIAARRGGPTPSTKRKPNA
jgi:AcrR family transcriptional regulator